MNEIQRSHIEHIDDLHRFFSKRSLNIQNLSMIATSSCFGLPYSFVRGFFFSSFVHGFMLYDLCWIRNISFSLLCFFGVAVAFIFQNSQKSEES